MVEYILCHFLSNLECFLYTVWIKFIPHFMTSIPLNWSLVFLIIQSLIWWLKCFVLEQSIFKAKHLRSLVRGLVQDFEWLNRRTWLKYTLHTNYISESNLGKILQLAFLNITWQFQKSTITFHQYFFAKKVIVEIKRFYQEIRAEIYIIT